MTLFHSFSSLGISSLRLSLSTVLKSLLTFHFSFHFNMSTDISFFLSKKSLSSDVVCINLLYFRGSFSTSTLSYWTWALLKHILQRAKLSFFFCPSRYDISIICEYTHNFNTDKVRIRPVIVSECFHATTNFRLVTRPLKILRNLQGKMRHPWSWTFLCQSRFVAKPPS